MRICADPVHVSTEMPILATSGSNHSISKLGLSLSYDSLKKTRNCAFEIAPKMTHSDRVNDSSKLKKKRLKIRGV